MTNTLTVSNVALAAGVTRATIYNWLKEGKIPVEPIEGTKPPRFPVDPICEWLQINRDNLQALLSDTAV